MWAMQTMETLDPIGSVAILVPTEICKTHEEACKFATWIETVIVLPHINGIHHSWLTSYHVAGGCRV